MPPWCSRYNLVRPLHPSLSHPTEVERGRACGMGGGPPLNLDSGHSVYVSLVAPVVTAPLRETFLREADTIPVVSKPPLPAANRLVIMLSCPRAMSTPHTHKSTI